MIDLLDFVLCPVHGLLRFWPMLIAVVPVALTSFKIFFRSTKRTISGA